MENKLTKMMKLAPNVQDSLEKINYITAIPEQTKSPVAAAAAGATPKTPAQAARDSGAIKK